MEARNRRDVANHGGTEAQSGKPQTKREAGRKIYGGKILTQSPQSGAEKRRPNDGLVDFWIDGLMAEPGMAGRCCGKKMEEIENGREV